MNRQEYNRMIEETLKTKPAQTENSLETARAVLNHMGISLPQGDLRQVSEALATDDYMGWRKCTAEEAQTAANDGTAAVAFAGDTVVMVMAEADDEDEIVTATSSKTVATVSQLDSQTVQYYTNRAATTTKPMNSLFDMSKKDALKNDLVNLLGIKKSSLHHYTTEECVNLILNHDAIITYCCNLYDVPKLLIQTLLLRELWCVNITDDSMDDFVIAYYGWKQACEDWENASEITQQTTPYPAKPAVTATDSSTGIGQMFGWVAINAHNLAIDKHLINAAKYDSDDWHDLYNVWTSLRSNNGFAIKMMAFEMYHCADYAGVTGSLFDCSTSQIKKILSRYNGTGNDAVAYGSECYEYYKIFKKYS